MEEEIDLRKYIEVLLRRWYWVVGLALVGSIVAFIVSSLLTPLYEAEAQVLILESWTDVSFEPRIRSDTVAIPFGVDQTTLVSLVKSPDVANILQAEFKDRLPDDANTVFQILDKIETTTEGNIIVIKVRDKDPALAAELADAWAKVAERYINQLFNEQKSDIMAQVQSQVEDVQADYAQSQFELETFLSNNQITMLQQSVDALTQGLNSQNGLLAAKYAELNLIDAWLSDAYTVKDQVENETTSSGARLGDLMAMADLRSSSSSLAMRTRLIISGTTVEVPAPRFDIQLVDLAENNGEAATSAETADMIAVIEARRDRTLSDIEQLSNALLETNSGLALNAPVNEAGLPTNELVRQIQVLESRLEAQQAELRELSEERDQAWENLKSVQQKLAEVQLGTQIPDSKVRVAAHAVLPDSPVSPRRLLNTLIGGVLGGILGLLSIFSMEYWQSQPRTQHQEDKAAS